MLDATSNIPQQFDWSTANVDKLTALWADGLSASQIGAEMGCTRNSIIGKVHRLGLPSHRTVYSQPKERKLRPVKTQINYGRLRAQKAARQRGEKPAPVETPPLVTRPCSLLELTDTTCRWPIGDPGETSFHFCGSESYPGKPYCAAHARIAYQPYAGGVRSTFRTIGWRAA